MRALRHRVARIVGAWMFAALLFVPLVERGHSHADRDLARPCAACVAAHHSPAAATPIVAVVSTAVQSAAAVFAPIVAATRRAHSPQGGRAPPHFPDIAIV